MQAQITDDLDALLGVLPDGIHERLLVNGRKDLLLEVILDLGRVPTARYTDGEVTLAEAEVTHDDIQSVVTRIGAFDADNRAGIARTFGPGTPLPEIVEFIKNRFEGGSNDNKD